MIYLASISEDTIIMSSFIAFCLMGWILALTGFGYKKKR